MIIQSLTDHLGRHRTAVDFPVWRPELPAALRAAIAMLVPTLLFLAVRRRLNAARGKPRDGLGPEIR